jgi:hypothetical protein
MLLYPIVALVSSIANLVVARHNQGHMPLKSAQSLNFQGQNGAGHSFPNPEMIKVETLPTTVGVLLNELPSSLVPTATSYFIQSAPESFWVSRAKKQILLTMNRKHICFC